MGPLEGRRPSNWPDGGYRKRSALQIEGPAVPFMGPTARENEEPLVQIVRIQDLMQSVQRGVGPF